MGRHGPCNAFSVAEVYALTCPVTGSDRYIGMSVRSSWTRYRKHLGPDALAPVRDWVSSLGEKPGLRIVEGGLSYREAVALERRLILSTPNLLNRQRHGDRKRVQHDRDVTVCPNMLKWWRLQLNDDLGPWYGADLKRRP